MQIHNIVQQKSSHRTDSALLNANVTSQIRRLLTARGASQSDLSRASGIPKGAVSKLMASQADWLPHHLDAVARALGVTPRDLMPGPGEWSGGEADGVRINPSEPALSPAEVRLLEAVRLGDARAALGALAALLPAERATAEDSARSAPSSPLQVVLLAMAEFVAANTDAPASTPHAGRVPGETRRRLEALLEPKRMRAGEPPRQSAPAKRKDER